MRRLGVGILRMAYVDIELISCLVTQSVCFLDAAYMVQFGNVSMVFSYLAEDTKKPHHTFGV